MIYCYSSNSYSPYKNLATEDFFVDFVNNNPENLILYFWQNENTVVIGRNQDAFSECNIKNLNKLNAKLARRKTGGGAVFHDKNNLNFSFVIPKKIFNKQKSMEIIKNALLKTGFNAEISGRNDILVNGAKCSGNAYYTGKNVQLHHGTILVDTDVDTMNKLLLVNKEKLKSHGVKSVQSRVVNLKQINPTITIAEIKENITQEFAKNYKMPLKIFSISEKETEEKEKFFADEKWIYGDKKFSNIKSFDKKFEWGLCSIKIIKGTRTEVKIYSDTLEFEAVNLAQEIINNNLQSFSNENHTVSDIINFYNEIKTLQ